MSGRPEAAAILAATTLTAGYHGGTVLHGIDLTLRQGEVAVLLGHNGAGKTTLLHTLAGLLRPASGTLRLDGADATGRPAHRLARAGIALVPQGRRMFTGLTVAEHLAVAHRRRATWTPQRVLGLLPQLGERLPQRAETLSGGEQQMLAIGRALLTGPRVLLLDEPTEGLAPRIAADILAVVGDLAADGIAVLLAAPRPGPVLPLADRVTVLRTGRVVAELDGPAARSDPASLEAALATH